GAVERRGLCGDVFLTSRPAGPRIADVKVDTSVRKGEVTFTVALEGIAAKAYLLRVAVRADGQTVRTLQQAFTARDLQGGRVAITTPWKPAKLWDVHTPGNRYSAQVALLDPADDLLDAWYPVRFGFREFWIDGRDFYLNGTRIYLSAVPLDSAQL